MSLIKVINLYDNLYLKYKNTFHNREFNRIENGYFIFDDNYANYNYLHCLSEDAEVTSVGVRYKLSESIDLSSYSGVKTYLGGGQTIWEEEEVPTGDLGITHIDKELNSTLLIAYKKANGELEEIAQLIDFCS